MALIHNESCCAICQGSLDDGYLATSGCAFAHDHPLWKFCDAPIHWSCYRHWPSRAEFAAAYHAGHLTHTEISPFWHTILRSDRFLATLQPRIQQVQLHSISTGVPIVYLRDSWPAPTEALHPDHAFLVADDLQRFHASHPDWDSLFRDFDPQVYQRGLDEYDAQRQALHEAQQRALRAELAPHHAECARMLQRLQTDELECPSCQRMHSQIRFYDRSPDRKSIFICQICGSSFGPEGLPAWR